MRFSVLLFILALLTPHVAHAATPLNSIAAVVNGEMITSFDLQAEMAPELLRMGLDPRKQDNSDRVRAVSRRVLDAMINNIILAQEAERLHMGASESDIDSEIRQIMERNRLTPAEFQRQIQLQGMTEKAFRERIRRVVLRNRLLSTMVGRKVVVTKDEIMAYYAEHKDMFKNNQSVRFSVLVYPPTVDAEKTAAGIKSGALRFDRVVRELSVGPKPKEGGDLGEMPWSSLDPAWRDRLSELAPGEVSDIFEVNGLKTQVRLAELSSGEGQSLDEAYEQIEAILREPKLQQRFEEYTAQLRKRAMIDIRL